MQIDLFIRKVFCSLLLAWSYITVCAVSLDAYLLTPDNKPTKPLQELLALTHIVHDGTLQTIVPATQKAWLRQAGTERWHMEEKHPELRAQILTLCEQLGCKDAVLSTQNHYTYAFILGATLPAMRLRLAHLIELHSKGITFDHIIFCGGTRILDKDRDSLTQLVNPANGILNFKKDWQLIGPLPTNEYEMATIIIEQTALPESLSHIPITVIKAIPSNTTGTITQWLATDPASGSCLFISCQPYVGYQDSAIRATLPATFAGQTIGKAASSTITIAALLDNLARWLYQEQQRRNSPV